MVTTTFRQRRRLPTFQAPFPLWMTTTLLLFSRSLTHPIRAFRPLPLCCHCFWTHAFPTGSSTPTSSSSIPDRHQSYPHQHQRKRTFAATSSALYSYNNQSAAATLIVEDEEVVEEEDIMEQASMSMPLFPDEIVETDTYNGIILRLDHTAADNSPIVQKAESFRTCLEESLARWKQEGRKGIWMYVPNARADLVPIASAVGFNFHMVNKEGQLILSHWIPTDIPSRLPRGPMYQVGVGCIVLKPGDPTQMLVVKELTGPAAAMDLWKMPTGLADPAEDIHEAAIRELAEETGLDAVCDGILVFRQSHAARSGTRAASDLFFVCRMKLVDETKSTWTAQPEEIADIRWMPIREFCDQDVWKNSPLYQELNGVCLNANERHVFAPAKLPIGLDRAPPNSTNTLYKSQL